MKKIVSLVMISVLGIGGILLLNQKKHSSTTVIQETFSESPSKKYTLERMAVMDKSGVAGYSFKITDKSGTLVFQAEDYFRKRDKFLLDWGEAEDIVWVYSGDIGLYYWQYSEMTNEWQKYSYVNSGGPVPELPKKMYEKLPTVYQ